jgi:hypothetical protein
MRTCRRSANSLAVVAALSVVSAGHGATAVPPGPTDAASAAREALGSALTKARGHILPAPVMPRTIHDPKLARSIVHAAQHATEDRHLRDRAADDLTTAKAGTAAQSQAMAERLHQALGIDAPPVSAMTQTASVEPAGYVPLLFVSASMPIDELRTYASQIEKTGGALAFRGMPGGLHRVAPMAELSARILRIDPGCSGPACRMRSVPIVVDPIAFRRAGVIAVPALAMVPGDPTTPYCERDDGNAGPDILVSGDAALSGLFEQYARLGGAKEVADAQARLARR